MGNEIAPQGPERFNPPPGWPRPPRDWTPPPSTGGRVLHGHRRPPAGGSGSIRQAHLELRMDDPIKRLKDYEKSIAGWRLPGIA